VSPVKEMEKVCYGFLRFYSEVDPVIAAKSLTDPITAMRLYTRNPGHVVQTLRKTIVFLEGEMISLKIAREVNEMVAKTPPEVIGCVDKTMTGFLFWDLIRQALEFYGLYASYHYNIDIYDKNLILDDHELNYYPNLFTKPMKILPLHLAMQKSDFQSTPVKNLVKKATDPKRKSAKSVSPQKLPPNQSKTFKRLSTDSDLQPHSETYETFVTEQFHTFLLSKLKTSSSSSHLSLESQKTELLSEFTSFISSLDQTKISSLCPSSLPDTFKSRLSF
jgi:hypothetical protein